MKAKMQIEVELNGKTYRSAVNEVETIQKVASDFKDAINEVNRLSLALEDGSYLVIGEAALKSCAFIIKSVV